jgi:hypothetical protein
MEIERTDKEIIIRLPVNIKTEDLQDFLDYLSYKQSTSDVEVAHEKVDELASEVNKNWWKANRKRFVK